MITEDYVSFETAKLLKEKRFDEATYHDYDEKGRRWFEEVLVCHNLEGGIACPTLQMAMKWLREEHHFHIFTVPKWEDVEYMSGEWEEQMIGYQYVILDIGGTNRKINQPITTALSPESSYEAAIKYCLENLIQL